MASPDNGVTPPVPDVAPAGRKPLLPASRLSLAESAQETVVGSVSEGRCEMAPPAVPAYLRETYY